MRSHLHRPRRDRSRMAPPKAGTAPEPVVQLVGLHTPATSGCSCGGRCPRCQRRANAKTALAALGRNGRTAGHALPLSVPGDHFERQAQRVAERVANTPPGAMTAPDRIDGETPAVQRAPALAPAPVDVSGAPPSVRAALASVGRPLEPTVRGDMERRLGLDLGHVRIHDGAVADASARVLGARAYTIGAHVVFRGGAFDPATRGGRRLLAHELVHVAQQTRRSRTAAAWWRPLSGRTMIQGDLAIRPPRGDRDGRTLGAAEMTAALDFNRTYFANLPNSAALIEVIRDTIGTNRTPAVIDQDFVRAVVTWQAMFGLGQDGKLGSRTARPLFPRARGRARRQVCGGQRPALQHQGAAERRARRDTHHHVQPSRQIQERSGEWYLSLVLRGATGHPVGRRLRDRLGRRRQRPRPSCRLPRGTSFRALDRGPRHRQHAIRAPVRTVSPLPDAATAIWTAPAIRTAPSAIVIAAKTTRWVSRRTGGPIYSGCGSSTCVTGVGGWRAPARCDSIGCEPDGRRAGPARGRDAGRTAGVDRESWGQDVTDLVARMLLGVGRVLAVGAGRGRLCGAGRTRRQANSLDRELPSHGGDPTRRPRRRGAARRRPGLAGRT